MARTVTQSFKDFKSNLEITGLQESTVSTRQKNVRAVLDNGLTVLDCFLTGSYSRSTMIAPLKEADVDIFVVLDSSYYKVDGYTSLLDKVKGVVKKNIKHPTLVETGKLSQLNLMILWLMLFQAFIEMVEDSLYPIQ